MRPFQEITTDFLKETAKIIEEFQAQCQAIAYEFPQLDLSTNISCFRYMPAASNPELNENASSEDIKLKIIEISKKSPKELLLSSHFVNKVKNNLEAEGLSASKVKIRKIIENLRSEGVIDFPDVTE